MPIWFVRPSDDGKMCAKWTKSDCGKNAPLAAILQKRPCASQLRLSMLESKSFITLKSYWPFFNESQEIGFANRYSTSLFSTYFVTKEISLTKVATNFWFAYLPIVEEISTELNRIPNAKTAVFILGWYLSNCESEWRLPPFFKR